jgi:predicted nucleic acid-binding protein
LSLYLDASAILPILITERSSHVVNRFLNDQPDPLVVTEFAAAEVASGLSRLARMGAIDRASADRHLADFDLWRERLSQPLDIQASDFRLASDFVRRLDLGLRAPDALHVAVCRRADLSRVTVERRLASAAEALGVRVTNPAG